MLTTFGDDSLTTAFSFLIRMIESDEYPPEVFGVLVDAGVEGFDLFLLEEPQHVLLQRARPLARDDLDKGSLRGDRLSDHLVEGAIDIASFVVNVVEIKDKLHR